MGTIHFILPNMLCGVKAKSKQMSLESFEEVGE